MNKKQIMKERLCYHGSKINKKIVVVTKLEAADGS